MAFSTRAQPTSPHGRIAIHVFLNPSSIHIAPWENSHSWLPRLGLHPQHPFGPQVQVSTRNITNTTNSTNEQISTHKGSPKVSSSNTLKSHGSTFLWVNQPRVSFAWVYVPMDSTLNGFDHMGLRSHEFINYKSYPHHNTTTITMHEMQVSAKYNSCIP